MSQKTSEEQPVSLAEQVREGLGQGLLGDALVQHLEPDFPGNREEIVACVEEQTAALWKEFSRPVEAHHEQACAFYRSVKRCADANLSQKLRAQQKLDELEHVAERAAEFRETGRCDPVVLEAFGFYRWVQALAEANLAQQMRARMGLDRLLGVSGPFRVAVMSPQRMPAEEHRPSPADRAAPRPQKLAV